MGYWNPDLYFEMQNNYVRNESVEDTAKCIVSSRKLWDIYGASLILCINR